LCSATSSPRPAREEAGSAASNEGTDVANPKPSGLGELEHFRQFFGVGRRQRLVIENVDLELIGNNSDDPFPAYGPYLCALCLSLFKSNHEFVAHIKGRHSDDLDLEVLRVMEDALQYQTITID
jgi:hypothetical protein